MIEQQFEKHQKGAGKLLAPDVLALETLDPQGLSDIQQMPTLDMIPIQRVGLTRFRLPVFVERGAEKSSHDAQASMGVALTEKKQGVSMSRLCSILQEEALSRPIKPAFFEKVLNRYRLELGDKQDQNPIGRTFLHLEFSYPVRQQSLKSGNWGWQYYPVRLEGELTDKGPTLMLELSYEYSSTCPSSLSLAKQYESDFAAGESTEGVGIGVPHSQRSRAKVKVAIKAGSDFFIESLIELIRQAIPTETQSLVKRVDEQAFAILNGAHPMFVEHAARRLYRALNGQEDIVDWLVEIVHLESLHSHNAAAVLYKGVPGGLKQDTLF